MPSVADDFDLNAFDFEDDEEQPKPKAKAPKQLRDYADSLKQKLADATKALAEERSKNRARNVSDILRSKGVEEAKVGPLAEFIPSDVDASDEAVTGWLTKYATVFGVEIKTDTSATPDEQDAVQRFAQMVDGATKPAAMDESSYIAAMQAAKNPDELAAVNKRFFGE